MALVNTFRTQPAGIMFPPIFIFEDLEAGAAHGRSPSFRRPCLQAL